MKKIIFLLCLLFLAVFLQAGSRRVIADCGDSCNDDASCQQRIEECTQKIADSQNQEKTLSSQITLINNEISLTKVRINQTQVKIDRLTDDIASVSGKIGVLENSLTEVSNVLVNRIIKTYIVGRSDPTLYLLSARDFTDFLKRLEYLRLVQKHDKTLMYQMAATKQNYNDQKDLLGNKKNQVEVLSAQLKAYQNDLNTQNRDKERLLEVTRNDESRYQQLLEEARSQLAAFQGFVISQGGASLLPHQDFCDSWGCYYNQRDSAWGLTTIGYSSDTLAEYGCLITSSAMVLSHYGHKVTPGQVAKVYDAFFASTALMLLSPWSIDGATFTRTSIGLDFDRMDSELSSGHPVIVGIGAGPAHFVVIKEKKDGQYIMNDPYVENGHDIPFTSKYSLGSISAINVVRVN